MMSLREKRNAGQMTIEFMIALPVLIIVLAIACNAVLFLSECAAFDRCARNAIRIYATSPGYGIDAENIRAEIKNAVTTSCESDYTEIEVSLEGSGVGLETYQVNLSYTPNLFGLGLKDSVLGVSLPRLNHAVRLSVDRYRPGVLL